MYKNKPKMAKKWEKETPKGAKLPKKVKSKGKRKQRSANINVSNIGEDKKR